MSGPSGSHPRRPIPGTVGRRSRPGGGRPGAGDPGGGPSGGGAAHRRGLAAEEVAARHLTAAGWTVLGRRIRVGRHEVDLLAVDPGPPAHLVLVEVRFRSRTDFGEAEETVGAAKRGHLAILLGIFLARRSLPDGTPLPPLPRRVDLIVVEPGRGRKPQIRHHRGLELGG